MNFQERLQNLKNITTPPNPSESEPNNSLELNKRDINFDLLRPTVTPEKIQEAKDKAERERLEKERIEKELEIQNEDGTFLSVAKDVGLGIVEAPRAILGGLEGAINETASFFGDIEDATEEFLGIGRLVWREDSWWPEYINREEVKKLQAEGKIGLGNTIFEGIENVDIISDEYLSVTGGIAKNIAQFTFGMLGAGKLTKLKSGVTGIKGFRNSMVNAAIADAVVFDPEMDNISAFLQENQWADNVVTEYLATDMDDSKLVNRLRNASEGAIIGLPFELLVRGIRLAKIKQELKVDPTDKKKLEQVDEIENQILDLSKGGENIKGHKPTEKQLTDAKNWMGKKKQIDIDKIKFNSEVEAQKVQNTISKKNKDPMGEALRIKLVKDFENQTLITDHYYKDGKLTFMNGEKVKPKIVKKDKNGKEYIDEDEYRKVGTLILKDPTRETGVDDLIAAGKGTDISVDESVNQVLNLQSLEKVTALAKDFKDMSLEKGYDGIKWDNNARVIDNIFNMALSDKMDTKRLLSTLLDNGMSYNEFILSTVGTGSQAGKILQKLSQVNKMANQSLKGLDADQAAQAALDNAGNMHKFFLRVENIRRGLMVSSIATASRNLTSAFIRMPLEGIGNVLDNALYDVSTGGLGKALYGLTKGQNWKDAFAHHSLLTAKDLKTLDDDVLFKGKDMQKWYDRMYGQMNEVRQLTGRQDKGAIGAGEYTMQRIENVVDFLNIPNRWQEFTIRRATMYGELQRQMRREWGQDFFKLLEDGKLNAIKNNDPLLRSNKNAKTFEELMEAAATKALDVTYAKQPNTPPLRDITTFMTKYGGTLIIPFPRFMFNSMELMGNYAFGASIPLTKRVLNTVMLKKSGPLSELDRQRVSRNIVGVTTALAFMQYRESSESADYKFIPVNDRAKVDTTPQFPMRQFLWLGEALKRGKEGTFGEFWNWKEFSETFGGTNFRAGTGNVIMDEINSIVDGVDREGVSEEKFGEITGKLVGNYIGSWAIPLAQIADAQRALGIREEAMKDVEPQDRGIISGGERFKQELIAPLDRRGVLNLFNPSAEKEFPDKQYLFQEGDTKDRMYTPLRVLGGINIVERSSKEGQYFESLGLREYLLDSNSDIPSVKNIENKLMREALPLIMEQVKNKEKEILRVENETDLRNAQLGYEGDDIPTKEELARKMIIQFAKDKLTEARNIAQDAAVPEMKKTASALLMLTTEYRKIGTKQRQIGYMEFKREFFREPNYLDEDDLVNLIKFSKAKVK